MEVTREVRTTKNGTPKYVYLYDGMEFSRKKEALQVKERDDSARSKCDNDARAEQCDGELVDETTAVTLQKSSESGFNEPLADSRVRGLANYASSLTSSVERYLANSARIFAEHDRRTAEYDREEEQRAKRTEERDIELKKRWDEIRSRSSECTVRPESTPD